MKIILSKECCELIALSQCIQGYGHARTTGVAIMLSARDNNRQSDIVNGFFPALSYGDPCAEMGDS